MERKHLKHLISNLFFNSHSVEDRAAIENWLNSAEAESDSRDAWESADDTIDADLQDIIFKNIQSKIKESEPAQTNRIKHLHNILYSWKMIAASIAVIFLIGIGAYLINNTNNIVDNKKNDNPYCFFVSPGQKGTILLADGTKVYLNSDTRISFGNDYNMDSRKVNLDGEAYFEVAKNPHKKFIVSCKGIEVEALGTEFNVKGYKSDSLITTTLARGKVKVSNEKQSLILLPKDVATYNPNKQSLVASTVDDISIADFWRSGQLVFKGETLSSISKTLERMYAVKIHIKDDKLKRMKFTGTIQNNSLNNVMHIISLSYPIRYRVADSTITITSNK